MAAKRKSTTGKKASVSKSKVITASSVKAVITEDKKDITSRSAIQKHKKILAIILIVVAALLYYFRSVYLVALVNSRPIFRTSVINELEKQGGTQVLESLVTRLLITQEAQKTGVTVSQSELDAEINKLTESISAQGQTLDQFLTFQGLTKEDLETNIRIQKLAEGLLADSIQVTDEEFDAYMTENAETLPPEVSEEQIREQLKQQKLSTEFQTFITNLQETSDIKYIREY